MVVKCEFASRRAYLRWYYHSSRHSRTVWLEYTSRLRSAPEFIVYGPNSHSGGHGWWAIGMWATSLVDLYWWNWENDAQT
jgi:hypothetical protein